MKPHIAEPDYGTDEPVNTVEGTLLLEVGKPMRQAVPAFLFFLLVLLLVYAPSFSGIWIYDDEPNILDNDNVHMERVNFASLKKAFFLKSQDPHIAERIKRPLAYLSFALNWYVGRDGVFGYHAVNFFIHLTATAFLYLFIKNSLLLPLFPGTNLNQAHLAAFLSAIIWSIHPVQVTAVTVIVQRMASMAGMFTIIGLYAYLKARTARTRPGIIGCFTACGLSALCAFATKENSAMLPVSLFFYEILIIRGVAHTDLKQWLRWGLPALAIVLLLGLLFVDPVRLMDGYGNRPYTAVERVMTESRVVFFYLKMLFYPLFSELTLVHDVDVSTSLWSPWTTLPAIILVPTLFCTAWAWLSERQPFVAFAIVFFFLNHLIEGTFIGLELIYEHRNYIPSMMLFFIPAMLLIKTLNYFSYHRQLQMMIVVSGAVVLASIGHSTYAYNDLFRHGLIFWRDNARKSPGLSVVQNNYGIELMKYGFNEKAYQTLQRAMTSDRYFNLSQEAVTHHNLGVYHEVVQKDYKLALSCFNRANEIMVNSKKMGLSFSMAQLVNGHVTKAEELVDNALKKWPDDPDTLAAMAKIKLVEGKTEAALKYARQARSASNGAVAPLAIFGEVYRLQGDLKRSVFFWQAYRRQRPHSITAALALAELYHRTDSSDRLSRVVADLMDAKGNRAWDVWLQDRLSDDKLSEPVIYAQDPQHILSVISDSLRLESEKAGKGH